MSTGDVISCLCTIFSTDHNCTQVLKTLTYYTLIAVEHVHQKSFFDFLQAHLGVLNKNETHTDEMMDILTYCSQFPSEDHNIRVGIPLSVSFITKQLNLY